MVAIYTRSAAKNNESIAEQKHKCLSLVDGQEVKFYTDNGVSGLVLKRTGLDDLIQSAKEGSIKKVITTDPSRLSRNPTEVERIVKELAFLGVSVEYSDY